MKVVPSAWFALLLAAIPAARALEPAEFFEKQVRPLLAEHCYECHGEKKQKGGLRLDSRAGWETGGESGRVIIPGKPDESLLIKAVSYSDPDLQMPPKNRLSATQVELLRSWIKSGAIAPSTVATASAKKEPVAIDAERDWEYQPLRKNRPPEVRNQRWPRNDIDRFILARIEKAGVKPAPDASRAVLLRRLSFDLTGLPPSPADLAAFIQDETPGAVERAVDRMLDSPRFGERWARHWMDVVRFGESVTLRGLVFQNAWRYRDYLIDSFNRDIPFDQFIREQIAGDLLPAASMEQRQRQRIATAFLAIGNTNFEEQDKGQLRMDVVDEQLDTLGKALLGQTIGCARCHDHKFDPIPTRDYYAMAGILRNTRTMEHANVSRWLDIPLPLEPEQEAVWSERKEQLAAVEKKIQHTREIISRFEKGPPIVKVSELPGIVLDDSAARQVGNWRVSKFSKNYVGDGYLSDDNTAKGEQTVTFQPALPRAGRYEVRFAYSGGAGRATNVPVTIFHAEGETTVRVDESRAATLSGRFVSLGQFRFEVGNQAYVLVSNEGTAGFVTVDAVQFLPLENNGSPEAASAPGAREPNEVMAARAGLKLLEAGQKKLKALLATRPAAISIEEEAKMEDCPVHIRGSVHRLGETVPRGFLSAVQVAATAPRPGESGRRELAEWLVHRDNPLTARVYVNRTWQWLFGTGLVETPDNFGRTGARPSHPELLDYLAIQFRDAGWSTKKLVKMLVRSRAYQLSTGNGVARRDPGNRLFSRATSRPLEAECLRDAILQASGELQFPAGGPGLPPELADDYGYHDASPRRTVYLPVLRNAVPEVVQLFDGADPSLVTGKRNATTVAPQALFLLNSPWVMERARKTAEQIVNSRDKSGIDSLYASLLSRSPTASERRIARSFVTSGGGEPVDRWAQLVQALYCSPEFRYLN